MRVVRVRAALLLIAIVINVKGRGKAFIIMTLNAVACVPTIYRIFVLILL